MGAARGRLCECADSDVALDGEDVGGLPLHAAARPAVGERLLAALLAVLVRVGAVVHLGLGAVRLFAVGLARHDTPTAELDGERVEVSSVLRVGLQHTPHVLGELVPLGQQLVDQVHQRGGAAPGHPILLLRTRTHTHVRASRLLVQLAVGVVQRTYHDDGETGSGLLHVQGAVGVYALAQDSLTTHNTALCIADGGAELPVGGHAHILVVCERVLPVDVRVPVDDLHGLLRQRRVHDLVVLSGRARRRHRLRRWLRWLHQQ